MKRILISISIVALSITAAQAQVNRDKNETTTVKKVTQKDTDVKTKVIKETNTENEVIEVEGNNMQDQTSKVISNKSANTEVIADDVSVDMANQQGRMDIKDRQEMELQKAIAAQKEKAAMEAEKERQAKLMEQQKALDARRAALMSRPEGMAKLKKD